MNKKNILDSLKRGLISVANIQDTQEFFGTKNSKSPTRQKYYVSDLKYNLYKFIVPEFKLGKDPDALRSSAAMIYNTIYSGNIIIDHTKFNGFEKDGFPIYELPFPAIKDDKESTHTAQLDAGLISIDGQKLILFEAKCMEWADKNPKGLKKAYLKEDGYLYPESSQLFIPLFKDLIYLDQYKKENGVCVYKPKEYIRYDAIQMLIHCLGIYNWCLGKKKNSEKNIEIIQLMNLVWDCKGLKEYDEEEKEGQKFEQFANSNLKEEFRKLGVNFSVEYVRYSDFLKRVDWSNDKEHQKYLERYEIK